MQISPQTQAVLLLTAHFSKSKRPDDARPLTPTEWGRFALWLKNAGKGPECLLQGNLHDTLSGWSDGHVSEIRISRLLDRGSALAIAMEKWQRTGLWVLARSDPDYPGKLKQRLGNTSPPVLYGSGNAQLLNRRALAVVGSRNASQGDLEYAAALGASAGGAGYLIVSGGARGIDEAAMAGALETGGEAVGVLSDSLMRTSSSRRYRQYLTSNKLALITSCHPEASFNAGSAMGRNKYIYCLSEAALVVHSGTRGGTWTGAMENIDQGWVPLWVRPTDDDSAGNAEIVSKGAHSAPTDIREIDELEFLSSGPAAVDPVSADDLFSAPLDEGLDEASSTNKLSGVGEKSAGDYFKPPKEPDDLTSNMALYDLFLLKLERECGQRSVTTAELGKRLGLQETQLICWLDQAVAENRVEKTTEPDGYRWL